LGGGVEFVGEGEAGAFLGEFRGVLGTADLGLGGEVVEVAAELLLEDGGEVRLVRAVGAGGEEVVGAGEALGGVGELLDLELEVGVVLGEGLAELGFLAGVVGLGNVPGDVGEGV